MTNTKIVIENKQKGNHGGKQPPKDCTDQEVLAERLGVECCQSKCMDLLNVRDLREIISAVRPKDIKNPSEHFNKEIVKWLSSCRVRLHFIIFRC